MIKQINFFFECLRFLSINRVEELHTQLVLTTSTRGLDDNAQGI